MNLIHIIVTFFFIASGQACLENCKSGEYCEYYTMLN